MGHRQRHRIQKSAQDFMSNSKKFINEFWPIPSSILTTQTDKLVKPKLSNYYPGGDWNSGKRNWVRPCFQNGFEFILIGDSELRQFHHGNATFDGMSITSFGGCCIRHVLIFFN